MKTAMMSVSPPGGGGTSNNTSAATESAIDAYATRVLRSKSPPEAVVDTSLGPYVTALLRCADLQDQEQVSNMAEFESLVELLEDQCRMLPEDAEEALKSIAIAVCTGAVPGSPQLYAERAPYMDSLGFLGTALQQQQAPQEEFTTTATTTSAAKTESTTGDVSASPQLYGEKDSYMDSFNLGFLGTALQQAHQEDFTTSKTSAMPESTTGAVSASPQLYGEKDSYPIPMDSFNLGFLGTALQQAHQEDFTTSKTPAKPESTTLEPYTPHSLGPSPLKPDNLIPVDLLGALDDESSHFSRTTTYAIFQEEKQQQEQQARDFEFPTLGAAAAAPAAKKNDKAGGRKKASKKHADKDLAAALFRPSRARQNSIAEEESPKLMPTTPAVAERDSSSNQYYQQQWDSSVEILLSMSPDLSEEAATEASRMAKTDFNIAQHIVDAALSAPPICRHMLHDGCYRSDCQFSHDVEGHTCVFWLRGRCGKGSGCKFLHGFNDKILDGIAIPDTTAVYSRSKAASSMVSASIPIASSIPKNGGWGGSSFQPSSAPSGGSFGGFSLPASGFDRGFELDEKLVQSWNKPSPMKEMLSTSNDDDTGFSFAKIASTGYDQSKFTSHENTSSGSLSSSNAATTLAVGTVRIPQDLWNPHENRDSSAFHIPDPLDRYHKVSLGVKRKDIVDLHFQSTKTFPVVLSTMLPEKLLEMSEVWIVTGTGHHVGGKTHQKGGGALERAVIQWLTDNGYNFFKGRDRNGLGGALLIKR